MNHFFEKFKTVKINVNVEAIGKRYEYIRPGSSWSQTSENLVKFNRLKPKNSNVTVSVLPMVFNHNNMDEIIDWCNDNEINCFKSTPVIRPAFMSPGAMEDKSLREKLIEQSEHCVFLSNGEMFDHLYDDLCFQVQQLLQLH